MGRDVLLTHSLLLLNDGLLGDDHIRRFSCVGHLRNFWSGACGMSECGWVCPVDSSGTVKHLNISCRSETVCLFSPFPDVQKPTSSIRVDQFSHISGRSRWRPSLSVHPVMYRNTPYIHGGDAHRVSLFFTGWCVDFKALRERRYPFDSDPSELKNSYLARKRKHCRNSENFAS